MACLSGVFNFSVAFALSIGCGGDLALLFRRIILEHLARLAMKG